MFSKIASFFMKHSSFTTPVYIVLTAILIFLVIKLNKIKPGSEGKEKKIRHLLLFLSGFFAVLLYTVIVISFRCFQPSQELLVNYTALLLGGGPIIIGVLIIYGLWKEKRK